MATPITNIRIYLAGQPHKLLATATQGGLLHAPGHNSQLLIQHAFMKNDEELESGKFYTITYTINENENAAIKHANLDIFYPPVFEDGTIWMFTETAKTKID